MQFVFIVTHIPPYIISVISIMIIPFGFQIQASDWK